MEKLIIRMAAEVIQKGWSQDSYARTRDGVSVDPLSPLAELFCPLGAMTKVRHVLGLSQEVLFRAERLLADRIDQGRDDLHWPAVSKFNDHPGMTKDRVAALMMEVGAK